jgi:hypothetical protein
MALTLATLASSPRSGNGNAVWFYTHQTDTQANFAAANYFNGAAALLGVNDVILAQSGAAVNAAVGGGLTVYYVSANNGATVTVVKGI